MCGGSNKKEKAPNLEGGATTQVSALEQNYAGAPQIVKDMIAAIALGPTGYSDSMRKNLGMDENIAGQDANGVRPVSKMTAQSAMPDGYTAVAPTPAKVTPIVPQKSAADRDLAGAAMNPAPAAPAASSGGGGVRRITMPMNGWNIQGEGGQEKFAEMMGIGGNR